MTDNRKANMSDIREKTAEEYREAAHFWQEKWKLSEEKIKRLEDGIKRLKSRGSSANSEKGETISDGKSLRGQGIDSGFDEQEDSGGVTGNIP